MRETKERFWHKYHWYLLLVPLVLLWCQHGLLSNWQRVLVVVLVLSKLVAAAAFYQKPFGKSYWFKAAGVLWEPAAWR